MLSGQPFRGVKESFSYLGPARAAGHDHILQLADRGCRPGAEREDQRAHTYEALIRRRHEEGMIGGGDGRIDHARELLWSRRLHAMVGHDLVEKLANGCSVGRRGFAICRPGQFGGPFLIRRGARRGKMRRG